MLLTKFKYENNSICESTSCELKQFDALLNYNRNRAMIWQNLLPGDVFVALDTVEDAAKILQGAETSDFVKGFAIISNKGDAKFALILEK